MRLLLLNPNTTEALTDRLAAAARAVLPADVELIPATASIGFPYISSRAEAQIAGAAVLATLAERQGDIDAAVIAAFGDPGLHAARELFDIPVTGMTEASMLTACSLGERFAFVTFTPALAPWYAAQVTQAGLGARFAGVHAPDLPVGRIDTVAEDIRQPIIDLCRRIAKQADVIVLSGAPVAGLASDIAADVDAVLVDPVQAAVLQACMLRRLVPKGAFAGSFVRPPAKSSTGLSDALASWFAHEG